MAYTYVFCYRCPCSDPWCCIKVNFKLYYRVNIHKLRRNLTKIFCGYRCEPTLAAHAVLLDKVKLLTSRRRIARVQSAATEALKELTKLGFGSVDTTPKIQKDIESLLRGQSSLAEFPYATLLTSVSVQSYGSIFADLLLNPNLEFFLNRMVENLVKKTF